MECDIFQSTSDPSKFIFVKSGTNPLAVVPSFIRNQLGEIRIFSTTILVSNGQMIGLDAAQIIASIEKIGYFATGVKKSDESVVLGAGLGAGLLAISLGAAPIIGAVVGFVAAILAAEKNKGTIK